MTHAIPEAPPPRSLPQRIAAVFLAPAELFEEFHHRTPWVGPLLISMVVLVAGIALLPPDLFLEQMREEMRRSGADAAAISAAESFARFAPLIGAFSALIGQPLMALLTAGLLVLIFNVLMGGSARFRQYLAVVTHTMLIQALGAAIVLPIRLLTRDPEVSLSAALFFPSWEAGSTGVRILNALDVFTLWAIVLLGLGAHVLNRRPSWPVATLAVFGLYLLMVLGVSLAAT